MRYKLDKTEPYYLLKKFLSKIPKGRVLDIGAGPGNNSIFLAENNFEVIAIDLDQKSIERLRALSKKENLNLIAQKIDVRKFKFNKYSFILAINCLQFMKKSERDIIIKKIKQSTKKEGFIFISVFTIHDNSYRKFVAKNQPVEKNTFYSKNENRYWNFFNPNELKSYFQNSFEILYYNEKIIEDTHLVPHQHGIAEIVARKKNASCL
ncbi:MAG: methyltransferase domain-containing protein [Candidatus Portnoybacteria bacterium]|nr:methyltransferase domain-containing protein [Candidatus Portnoybacteria bacterium]